MRAGITLLFVLGLLVAVASEVQAQGVCDDYKCYNGGSCRVQGDGKPECICLPDRKGAHCRTESFHGCDPNPCQHDGRCSLRQTGYGNRFVCQCLHGFSGVVCQNDVCEPNPCENGGVCRVGEDGNPSCTCASGYIGPKCSTVLANPCDPNPCQNNGRCQSERGDTSVNCTCQQGFAGQFCQVLQVCEGVRCYNGGTCYLDAAGSGICACLPGYTGYNCRTLKYRRCRPDLCRNGGTCSDTATEYGSHFNCSCPIGYGGEVCQTVIPTPRPTRPSGTGYNCDTYNPCDPLITPGLYYYPGEDQRSVVQCSTWGQCWVRSCAPGTIWDQTLLTCIHPPTDK